MGKHLNSVVKINLRILDKIITEIITEFRRISKFTRGFEKDTSFHINCGKDSLQLHLKKMFSKINSPFNLPFKINRY